MWCGIFSLVTKVTSEKREENFSSSTALVPKDWTCFVTR